MTRTGAPVRACKPQSTASMRRAGAAQSQAVELYSPATSEYVVTPVGHSVLRIHIVSRALRRRNAVEDAGHLYRASAHARTNQAADGRSSSSALVPARSSRGGLLSSCLRLRLLSPLLFLPLHWSSLSAVLSCPFRGESQRTRPRSERLIFDLEKFLGPSKLWLRAGMRGAGRQGCAAV